jgi:uncharacterized protein YceK
MKKLVFVFLAVIGLALSGCASRVKPAAEFPVAPDYGNAPSEYEPKVKAYFNSNLKDPFSAVIDSISAPEKGYLSTYQMPGLFSSSGIKEFRTYGWVVRTKVNAKNSYGGYIGWKNYAFLFRGDTLIMVDAPSS